uniref:DUF397 domain-containing protein n=1 Tax=Streptomyces sp. NBC_00093 TaxID=2975649 RepID=A0AAU2A2N7_9ACTN
MKNTPDLGTAEWRKSSYSDGGDNNCVEVADGYVGLVPVRDSKAPDSSLMLVIGTSAWASFVTGVIAGS